MRIRLLVSTSVLALSTLFAATSAHAAQTWWQADGASYTQAYIPSSGGVMLHADILRPADLAPGAKTPVILSIGPYFNHSGQTSVAGGYDAVGGGPNATFAQPSNRFQDFVDGTQLIKQGYTYMMVDLRGEGGSTGCWDWFGPGEQADVKSAVEWAASQPWSTGSVGMYGKSYDAGTGVIGEAVQPAGLKAIVAQEPVYDGYTYLYTNGVRFTNSIETPALFDAISSTPGQSSDSLQYNVNSVNDLDVAHPACPVTDWLSQAGDNNHASTFWQQRDMIAEAAGHSIPIFLTQGFLENNTKPLGAWQFFNELTGPKHAWFGMWDHVRGNDSAEGDNSAPHPWFDEVMRFYDHYVKGEPLSEAPTNLDPAVAVQTSNGTWRAEQQWPPLDSTDYATALTTGSYTDGFNAADSEDSGFNDTTGAGLWTVSPVLPYDVHLAGVPQVTVDTSSMVPNSDLSADVYDIAPNGSALLLSRGTELLQQGESESSIELYGNDWLIPAGDRIGVLVTSANDGWWTPAPTQSTVTVNSGTVHLPFLQYLRPASDALSGYKDPPRRRQWIGGNVWTGEANGGGVIALSPIPAADPSFNLPPQMTAAPVGFNSGAFGVGGGS
jgi:predicted acyl esterase